MCMCVCVCACMCVEEGHPNGTKSAIRTPLFERFSNGTKRRLSNDLCMLKEDFLMALKETLCMCVWCMCVFFGGGGSLMVALKECQHEARKQVLQCVAVYCSMLQHVTACCRVLQHEARKQVLQCVAVCCSVLQCVTVCCSVLQCVATWCSVLQHEARKQVLQCVAACCCVLLHFAMCCSTRRENGSAIQY